MDATNFEPSTADHQATPDLHDGPKTQQCGICYEQCIKPYKAPCGHIYCASCLRSHVRHSVHREATFPVACCDGEFPYADIKRYLAPHSQLQYTAAAVQYSVASHKRVFCASGCGTFLGSSDSAETLMCSKCKLATCKDCKEAQHTGQCIHSESALKDLARKEGWQTCTGCEAVIERNEGCNHISCRCGHQFCYLCGATWKTCNCQQWTQQNLQQALDLENGNGPPPAQEARCYRHDWFAVPGRRRCETCGRRRDQYRCRGCTAVSCRECRYPAGNYGIWWG